MSDWDTMRALLAGAPDLPGARCKGRCDLFERTTGEDRAAGRATAAELDDARRAALRLCETCPALHPCREYLRALPIAHRPRGVVAGQVITSNGRPMKTERAAEHERRDRGRRGADWEPAHP